MLDVSREETFSFRFISLSEREVALLRDVLPHLALIVRERNGNFVVSFEISRETAVEPLYSFIEENSINPDTYSVWISITTERDQSGIALPPHILKIIRHTKGGVDFSFIACLGE